MRRAKSKTIRITTTPWRLLRTAICVAAMTCAGLGGTPLTAGDVRIKDITEVEGVRTNQLVGMGLVTGLNGSGGKSPVTRRFAMNLLQRFGMRADPELRRLLQTDTSQKTDNLSVVTVTAELPSFAREGSRLDVSVAAFDDAKSLQGGQLIMTPLFGADGEVYAVASGPVSTGGFSFGGDAANVTKNHPTAGRIPDGAVIELNTLTPIGQGGFFRLLLNSPDFETARRIAEAINKLTPGAASVVDAAVISVKIPRENCHDVPAFIGAIGSLVVVPDTKARVVINERTGTVVVGDHVRVSSVLITHANLAVMTTEEPQVSQPAPFSEGETTTVPRTDLDVVEERAPINLLPETTTVGDLARALNALGVSPQDLSSIFQQLKESGALHAELLLK
ncbi:Flagellar P-ring protein precursor [Maioricimonas rarisocia]|uniref:Flagellar P-ring protein n=1 Tax=Maioricimonas rarisocia TaxID=2528026 RepID=A0A517ZCL3_9PLAN|nr:flagellar basal body P-ring protein FlgI [Maioricimonas rarisocia]QDU40236.1 Flagellar P-ring protein precursor [Maioricimonas rarisocia]